MDPRLNVIDERLSGAKRIIAVSGGKGGVGKSSVSSMLALVLADRGQQVGLLDLDFSGPSDHIILGVENLFPEEEKGIIPPEVNGIKFMSIIYFIEDNPLPFRGEDYSNAIVELLAITRWGDLDYLIIDMPPGINDVALDVIKLIKKIEFIMVGNRSKLTLETLKKVISMSKESGKKVLGVINNIRVPGNSEEGNKFTFLGVPLLGDIGLDRKYESSLSDVDTLLKTQFAEDLRAIILNNPEAF